MVSYTNLTANLNLTTFDQILQSANTTTNGTFWTAVYWMFILIVFLTSMSFGFEIAVILSFFGGLMVGFFLLYLGLINLITFGVSEVVLLFMVIYFLYSNRNN